MRGGGRNNGVRLTVVGEAHYLMCVMLRVSEYSFCKVATDSGSEQMHGL